MLLLNNTYSKSIKVIDIIFTYFNQNNRENMVNKNGGLYFIVRFKSF